MLFIRLPIFIHYNSIEVFQIFVANHSRIMNFHKSKFVTKLYKILWTH